MVTRYDMEQATGKRRRQGDQWSTCRHEIERLYLVQDLTLQEVRIAMKQPPRCFEATEQAYKKRLAQWNISKNIPASVVQVMLDRAQQRLHEHGKETVFYWHDVLVGQEKIHRTQKRLTKGPTPKAPSRALLRHLRCETPTNSDGVHLITTMSTAAGSSTADVAVQTGDKSPSRPRVGTSHTSLSVARVKLQKASSQHTQSIVDNALDQAFHMPSTIKVPLCFSILTDHDDSIDGLAVFDLLSEVTASLHDTSDMRQTSPTQEMMEAQERLTAAHLFLLGRNHPAYLSHRLLSCYHVSQTEIWPARIDLFKEVAPGAYELGSEYWPSKDVNTLARMALVFLRSPKVCKEAVDLLESAIGHPASKCTTWEPDSIFHAIKTASKGCNVVMLDKLLVLAIDICMGSTWHDEEISILRTLIAKALRWPENERFIRAVDIFVFKYWQSALKEATLQQGIEYMEFASIAMRCARITGALVVRLGYNIAEALVSTSSEMNPLRAAAMEVLKQLQAEPEQVRIDVLRYVSIGVNVGSQSLRACRITMALIDASCGGLGCQETFVRSTGTGEANLQFISSEKPQGVPEPLPSAHTGVLESSMDDIIGERMELGRTPQCDTHHAGVPEVPYETNTMLLENATRSYRCPWCLKSFLCTDESERDNERDRLHHPLPKLQNCSYPPSQPIDTTDTLHQFENQQQRVNQQFFTDWNTVDWSSTSRPTGTGYISPAALSRNASPFQGAFQSPESRRESHVSTMSGQELFNERLRSANEARASSAQPGHDSASVPSSPFRPNSSFAQEWQPELYSVSSRKGSARALNHAYSCNTYSRKPSKETTVYDSADVVLHTCEQIDPFTSKPCNRSFSRVDFLKRHENARHEVGKTKIRCPHSTGERSFRDDALARHVGVVHPGVDNAKTSEQQADPDISHGDGSTELSLERYRIMGPDAAFPRDPLTGLHNHEIGPPP